MKLITKRDVLKASVANFLSLYANGYREQYREFYNDSRAEACRKLDTDVCTEQEVAAVLNTSWTSLVCNECDKNVDVAVMVGQEPDYESATATVCLDCLKKAVELANKEEL